jgi:P27 family predicted phage terminase small subunit
MKKTSTTVKPPPALSPEARQWWKKLTNEYEMDDQAGLLLLRTAMEAFDDMRKAQAILDRDGLVIEDRFGQKRAHPLSATLRDSRTAMMRALKSLNLDIVPPGPVGRPAGR